MYNQPFYIPRYYGNMMPYMMRNSFGGNVILRGGFFSKIASAFGSLKNFNWTGLINNTSKTLGIINQTIPIVKQVGPVMNNVKSMVKIASIFKDETDSNYSINRSKDLNNYPVANTSSNYNDLSINNNDEISPTFFV